MDQTICNHGSIGSKEKNYPVSLISDFLIIEDYNIILLKKRKTPESLALEI
jgi:hypothetical protein